MTKPKSYIYILLSKELQIPIIYTIYSVNFLPEEEPVSTVSPSPTTNFSVYLLGIGLLQQGTPELRPLGGVDEKELALSSGKPVINYNIHPFSKLPKLRAWKTECESLPHPVLVKFFSLLSLVHYNKCFQDGLF